MMRRLIATTAATICAAALGLAPGTAAAAATPSPAWTVEAVPYPSAFAPGTAYDPSAAAPGYLVQAYDVGAAPTNGEPFKIVDLLPAGVVPAPGHPPTGHYGPRAGEAFVRSMSCSSLGRRVTCTGGSEGPLGPGEVASVVIPVEVQAGASGTLTDTATVEGGGAAAVSVSQESPVSSVPSPFGLLPDPAGFYGLTGQEDGSAATQAGSHPYQMTVAGMNLATDPGDLTSLLAPGGGLREATVTLPKGTVVDPLAVSRCREAELESGVTGCPPGSQVGTVALALSLTGGFGSGATIHPVYDMVPPAGSPAELGFEVIEGSYVHLLAAVSSDGTFTLTASGKDVLARVTIGGVRTTLWGEPAAASHDGQRGECLFDYLKSSCPVEAGERTGKAFLTMPSSCGGPLTTSAVLESWRGDRAEGSYESSDREGHPVGVEGCAALAFEPTISAKATTDQGESPSGLEFKLHQPQHEGYGELSTANLKDTTVTLPEGMVLNPAAAGGRDACSSAQIGLASVAGMTPIRYQEEPAHCPDASKLGTAKVKTALLDHELEGVVYLAKPFDNPFGSLLAMYLVVEDEQSGIIAKLAGKVEADGVNGQLTTTFEENPELPLDDVELKLFGGSRAALTTPITCGEHTTTSTLVPWSTPEGADAHPTSSFETSAGCYGSEAQAPKTFTFTAGTESPLAASYSPFVLRLSRPDGSQHFTGIETTLPEGLLGKLAGVSECSEAGIAQARSREQPEQGKLEIASPSCPASSEVGIINVTAGSGTTPFPVSGHAYMAGPYKGAPLSVVVIVPAVAGPFDLGTVVSRVALNVDPYTARIHAVSDPLPTIRDGIPLDVRSIELRLNRPQFTLNPSSCEVMAIEGSASTQAGQSAALNNRFQVGECGRLAFKPKLKISLKGATGRTGHPALKAVVTYPQGGAYSNIRRAQVNLPHSEFIDQGNLNKVCTRPVLLEGKCPAKSIYGHAKAWTPLLEAPLEGNVYLVGGFGYKLPALVAELNGKIRVLLVGKVDTGKNKGIRNTFEAAPDAPISRFVLNMKGGKKYSLLENSEPLCKKTQRGAARFVAQNGRVLTLHPKIANSCKKKASKKKAHKQHKAHKAKKGKKG